MIVKLKTLELQPKDDGSLPSEFRILRAGMNPTSKGALLFDGRAARSVMRSFERHGVDVMIDLEHLSLDTESNAFDPDARGWCKLDVRDGELWAVDVKWNDDGARRLSEKRQRYVSPVVLTMTADSGERVTELLNIAITALPATDHAQPLMAASKRRVRTRTLKMEDDKKEEMRARKLGKLRKLMALEDTAEPAEIAAALIELPADELIDVVVEALDDVAADVADVTETAPETTVEAASQRRDDGRVAARLAALEQRERESDLAELLRLNAAKLDPAREKTLRALAQRYGLDAARTFVEALPVAATPAAPATHTEALTEHEIALCARNKITPEQYRLTRRSMRRAGGV